MPKFIVRTKVLHDQVEFLPGAEINLEPAVAAPLQRVKAIMTQEEANKVKINNDSLKQQADSLNAKDAEIEQLRSELAAAKAGKPADDQTKKLN